MTKSPFLVFQDFIPPSLCEQIINTLEFYSPETDRDDKPIKAVRRNEKTESILFDRIEPLIPQITQHFSVNYKGIEPIYVEWYPEESEGTLVCDNSSYLRKKWVKTKDRDLTAVVFLNDYQDNVPFDSDFEVYGGKMEFPQWGFGFNPQRGTMIVYPSDPHFINKTTKILVGNLFQAKIHIATKEPLLFDIKKFPGSFTDWFKDTN